MIECPFCKKKNFEDAIQCSCGYFFNKKEYEKKQAIENKIAEESYESTNYVEVHLAQKLIKTGYIGGIIFILIGSYFLYLGHKAEVIHPVPIALIVVGLIAIGIKIQDFVRGQKRKPKNKKAVKEYKRFGE